MSCKLCGKQYVGNTTDHFRNKSDVRKAESGNIENVKQEFCQSHFLRRDHQGFLKDVYIWLIDKTQASDPTKRFYLMKTIRTLDPGDHIESDY